ncbi:MAG: SipW-dependent-type signal peptide-containing protein, partial [Candidatus Scatosoma sp.]
MKKKTIATSVLAIAMCSCLAIGGTYALFTSESNVNIAVTSGKVEVVATVNNLQAYSGAWNAQTSVYDSVVSTTPYTAEDASASGYYFSNGGFASVSTTANVVTLDRVTPMDKVTFDVVLTNNSTVTVQYRTVIKVEEDDGLFSGLEVKIGADEQVYGGTTTYSHWATLNAGSEPITVPVSIELPQEAGNQYQDKTCKISYTVEAVQGNARVYDGEAYLISGTARTEYNTVQEAINAAQTGDTVKVARAGTYAPFTVSTAGVTVEGIIADSYADSAVFKTTASANVQLLANDVTLKNVWVEVGEAQTGISWSTKGALNAYTAPHNNFTLDGCYFNGNNFVDRAFLFCKSKLTVKNCTFEGFNYCAFDSMDDNNTPEKIEIVGNTFKGLNVAYDIYAGKGYTGTEKNVVINNNVSDNNAIVRIWDYAQYVRPTEGSAFNAEVKGNTNISLYLTHFNNLWETDR